MNDGIRAVRRLAKLGYRAWVEGEVIIAIAKSSGRLIS